MKKNAILLKDFIIKPKKEVDTEIPLNEVSLSELKPIILNIYRKFTDKVTYHGASPVAFEREPQGYQTTNRR